MARFILWVCVIVGFGSIIINAIAGHPVDSGYKYTVLAIVAVLAICETFDEPGQ